VDEDGADSAEDGTATNPAERVVRAVDRVQQRHTALAVPVAVVRKFGDDGGGVLATSLAYSAFVAVFPLLLLFVTILGFVLGRSEDARDAVARSAAAEFPILGDQLVESLEPLRGSGVALAVGLGGLVWGGFGVTQAVQHAMAEIWNVPGVHRSGFVPRTLRGVAVLGVGGIGLLATSALASVSTFGGGFSGERLLAMVASAVLNGLLLIALFRMTTVGSIPLRQLVPGALLGGVAWSCLQALGGYLVGHQLRDASQVYGFFATVLGLASWIFLATRVLLYAAEVNVVVARRLWPRSLVQPPLTDADERALAAIARQEERRPEQTVEVAFDHGDGGRGRRTPQPPS
jgi:YihY family inner membrane protein